MNKPVIVLAKRTPIGKVGGIFKNTPPEALGAAVIQAILKESNIKPENIDKVILGNATGPGGNIARLTSLTASLPVEVPAMTIDLQCASGLAAIETACREIQTGQGDIYLAGGIESSSLAPWKLTQPTKRGESPTLFTRARFSPDFIGDPEMGVAADNVARHFHISRQDQDEYAYESNKKALHAQKDNRFKQEIVPLNEKYLDEGPRSKLKRKTLQRLKPIFTDNGSVTAGNSCTINDGAAVALLMSEEKALANGLHPLLTFIDATSVGVDPNLLGIGPVPAVKKLLDRNQLTQDAIDLVEFNEAFASQVLASVRELRIPMDRLNIGGGALAYGHPYGASGAVLISRLATEVRNTRAKNVLATLGVGGGLGMAMLLERYEAYDK